MSHRSWELSLGLEYSFFFEFCLCPIHTCTACIINETLLITSECLWNTCQYYFVFICPQLGIILRAEAKFFLECNLYYKIVVTYSLSTVRLNLFLHICPYNILEPFLSCNPATTINTNIRSTPNILNAYTIFYFNYDNVTHYLLL